MIFKFKHIFILLVYCFSYSCSHTDTKEVTVIFSSDQEIQLNIKNPIDGIHNTSYTSTIIKIKPDSSIVYHLNIDDFAYLRFDSEHPPIKQSLLLLEGSTTKVNINNGKINIDGDNSQGQEYLVNHITTRKTTREVANLIPIIESSISNDIDFEVLDNSLSDWQFNLKYKKDLEEMFKKKLISEKFYTKLLATSDHYTTTTIAQVYIQILQERIKDYQPTKEERKIIIECLDKLYSSPNILSEDSPQYLYYYLTDYYILKYYFLEEEKKTKLKEKYDSSIFGDYIGLMQAPDYVQLSQLGTIAKFEFQDGVGTLYNEEFLKWFQQKFPNKEYTEILTKLWNEKKEKENKNTNAIFLEREVINSFEDLTNTEELKGKTLYIDMWASWCSPCLAQFKYNKQTHKSLENYKNVAIVYISIDNDENDTIWKRQINFHGLDGYHVRATNSFVDYLSKTLYSGKLVSVPRYLILNQDNKVLDDNLPRPSQIEKLKKVLDEYLKND